MDYIVKKEEINQKTTELLTQYKTLLNECKLLSNKIEEILQSGDREIIKDFFETTLCQEDGVTIMRLISSLEYVEKPCDENIKKALKDNMRVNNRQNIRTKF